ncbi:MAG TPA: hypothetical protein VMQ44_02570 [Candidatus Saccharimonadales bacterium]|nr:hypothetical protein [Candidatus Saccharimonadales bacterium]
MANPIITRVLLTVFWVVAVSAPPEGLADGVGLLMPALEVGEVTIATVPDPLEELP